MYAAAEKGYPNGNGTHGCVVVCGGGACNTRIFKNNLAEKLTNNRNKWINSTKQEGRKKKKTHFLK